MHMTHSKLWNEKNVVLKTHCPLTVSYFGLIRIFFIIDYADQQQQSQNLSDPVNILTTENVGVNLCLGNENNFNKKN